MLPNSGGMKIVFHFCKTNIHNLSISNHIKIPKLNGIKAYVFRWSSFEGLNQPNEIGPIHFKQNFQLFWNEKNYG